VALHIQSSTVFLDLMRTVSSMTGVCLRTEVLTLACFLYTPSIMFTTR